MEQPVKRAPKGQEYGQKYQPSSNYDDQPGSGRKRRNNNDEDINPKIEKLLTAAGVATAIIIVVILAIVFSKVGGLFRSGSGKETVATTVAPTEETLSEKQVKMPDVSGLDSETAEKKLKDNGGLYMKISEYEYSDTVNKGDVISQDPKANTVVDKYSAVYVVISNGPEKASIDLKKLELESMDTASAKSLLEGKGLVVNVEQKNSDTVTAGKVISYSPGEAKEGETITLFSSSGPALVNPVVVPNLAGQTQEVAVEMLADVQLVQGTVTEASSETVARGNIISQSVAAGSQVESGSAVNFVISTGNGQESKYKYLASIDKSFSLQNIIGPGSGSTQLTLKIQLRQSVNGQDTVRELMQPTTLKGDQMLPVSFKNIEGAYNVTSGSVEIVNVETGEVVNSYAITFVAVPQS